MTRYLYGTEGNDTLDGIDEPEDDGSNDWVIDGRGGNDILYANYGNDYLIGGDGDDKLYADYFTGEGGFNTGGDYLTAGAATICSRA